MRCGAVFAALLISCGAQLSLAANVPIVNAGFEDVVLTCTAGPTCYSIGGVVGWTGTGDFGTFMPSVGPGGIYPGGIPEGVNVAALGDVGGSGVLGQTLGVTLQPNTTYTLTFNVGSRPDYPFAGYSVELLAGSTTVASDSSLAPPSGTFATGRIVYSTGANPTLLGQTLGIRLTGNAPGQANFDKISLDASPTGISSSVGQIASGAGWKTTLTIINLSAGPNSLTVSFHGDDGSPLILPLVVTQQGVVQSATTSSVNRTLGSGATLLIESEGPVSSSILVGWAEVLSSAPVSGFSIFRQRGQDGRDSEGTASLQSTTSSSLVLPFDNTAGFATGVALVNLMTDPVIVNAVIRDDNGTQIGLQAVVLSGKAHSSFFLADRFFVTSGRRGTIEFQNTAGGAVAGIGLRFNPFGSFTSVPIMIRQ
jgi:hypothetical protein